MFDSTIPRFLLSSQASLVGADRILQRRQARGELVRVRVGVYVEKRVWESLDYDTRYRVRVHAAAATLSNATQFSHESAAALWHLPTMGAWPTGVHVLSELASGGRSKPGIIRHSIGIDPVPSRINHAEVSSLARTVVDVARRSPFVRAVCMADAALHEPEKGSFRQVNGLPALTKADLEASLAASDSGVGNARAGRVMTFASGRSGSPGESLSRVQFLLMGFPPPELQVPFYDEEGFIGYVDFYWPELDLIGEFDGLVKYLGKTYRRGQLPEEVVLAEKQREDRLRRVARGFVRWDWTVANDQRLLAARVRPLGLLPVR